MLYLLNNAIFVKMKFIALITLTACCVFFFPRETVAQGFFEESNHPYDTAYILKYKDELTTRLYLSRKQNGYYLYNGLVNPWIKYKTNDNLLLGMGYTYSFLTLNLAVKMPFLNTDDDLYGETKYVDLQTNIVFRQYIADIYLQFNKGYYISNPKNVIPDYQRGEQYPVRGDLRTNIVGLNVQYLFNSERFSYKASFLQNEFQRKSAGSPIVGIESYWMMGFSDSVTVGGNVLPSGFLDDQHFNQTDMVNFGFNGGYAFTFVWQEKLYLSLSTVIGSSISKNWIHYTANSDTFESGLNWGLNNSTRISFGYNTNNYYVGFSYIRFAMTSRVAGDGAWLGYNTGNIRFNIVKRFITRRPIKILRPDLWIL